MNGDDNSKLAGCIGMDLEPFPIQTRNGKTKIVLMIDYQYTEGWMDDRDRAIRELKQN